ncbi:MAG: VRR-NUC domain-containing protein, partial [Candidatus Woesearchaeota archaeon]
LLQRAMYVVLQQFGFNINQERQTHLKEWLKCVYVPIPKSYTTRTGLSEKFLKRRLEKQGWKVWRGGSIHIIRSNELYPHVQRSYQHLCTLINSYSPYLEELQYLCEVHHGMPDFICFRNSHFKFVECKLGYEALSSKQKACFKKLTQLGFTVELHRLVEPCTKTRIALVNPLTGEKQVIEKQLKL